LNRSLLGYAGVAGAAVMWGTIGLAARQLFAIGLTPLEAAVWRAAAAFALLGALTLLTNRAALRVALPDLPLFAAYGAVSVAGYMVIYFAAIAATTVATAAMLLYTAPAWVVILARLFLGERLTPMKGAAVALACAGCALVVGALGPAGMRLTPAGLLAGLGAGLTYALYSIFGKRALRGYSPLTTVVYALGFGSLFLLAFARGLPPVPTGGAAPLLYLIVGPTTTAYLLYITGLRWIEAGRASVIATIEPLVAATGGSLILHEPFGPTQWLGAALVLTGVVLVGGEHLFGTDQGLGR
jgi:drug/metabolite transporter (DMT)-like permease